VVEASRANVILFSQACPRFVEFVEAGDTTSEELVAVAEKYLLPLKAKGVDTLILGCTHYPLLMGVIQFVMGEDVVLISSAEVTATEIYSQLLRHQMLNPSGGSHRFIASSHEGTFGELGSRFLGPEFGSVEYRSWDQA
jgi:glutamate racemase